MIFLLTLVEYSERSTNPTAAKALSSISKLQGTDAHATYIVTGNDKITLKELKINLTCENEFIDE